MRDSSSSLYAHDVGDAEASKSQKQVFIPGLEAEASLSNYRNSPEDAG